MSKYVALQHILHNGRMHSPGEVIDCPDPKLAKAWIANKAVKAVVPAAEVSATPKKVSTEAPIIPEVTPDVVDETVTVEPELDMAGESETVFTDTETVSVEPELDDTGEPEASPLVEPEGSPKLGRAAGSKK